MTVRLRLIAMPNDLSADEEYNLDREFSRIGPY